MSRMISYSTYVSQYTGAQIDEAIGAVLAGKAVIVTNCPNCGAPIENGKCPYCGTKFLKPMEGQHGSD